jgi:hypothetical protein
VEDCHQSLEHSFFWRDGSLRGDHYALWFNRELDPWLDPTEFVLQDDEEDEDDENDHDSEHCLKSWEDANDTYEFIQRACFILSGYTLILQGYEDLDDVDELRYDLQDPASLPAFLDELCREPSSP